MSSTTLTISAGAWTPLGAGPLKAQCKSTSPAWIVAAASQPLASVTSGDFALQAALGAVNFESSDLYWALPVDKAATIAWEPISLGSSGQAGATVAITETYVNGGVNLASPTPGLPIPVANSPILLAQARPGRQSVVILIENSVPIRINMTAAATSATSGALINPATDAAAITIPGGMAWYGQSADSTKTANVSIIEVW